MSVIKLATTSDRPKNKACATCRYLIMDRAGPIFWKCGVRGSYTSIEAGPTGDCGPEKFLWEPLPPVPPAPPSFWTRLGDALIARIRGGERT
jgi:hypothetical protein